MLFDETIVAIATPTQPARRGVVRLSGVDCLTVLSNLGIDFGRSTRPRRLDAILDLGAPLGAVAVAVLAWPTDRSYTGQPSAELHTHGSLPVLTSLVDACLRLGARAARPGEFTMRAFLAGRLDLTQAEAVLGVIEAEDPGSLDHALGQLAGNLSTPLSLIRSELLDLLADVEAGLDFVDEDIEFVSDDVLVARLKQILNTVSSAAQQMQSRGGGADSVSVVLRGEPNAGKSRLMNMLTGNESAIVADMAGTTRDVVSANASFSGHSVAIQDTAGIEQAQGHVSTESQRMGKLADHQATIRLWCVDVSRPDFSHAAQRAISEAGSSMSRKRNSIDLFVATKCDLVDESEFDFHCNEEVRWIRSSSTCPEGINTLIAAIAIAIEKNDAQETGSILGTAARCAQSISKCEQAITAAIDLTIAKSGHEFVSAELRLAAQCIGEVTGEVYNEDILDRVFGRFCIGK